MTTVLWSATLGFGHPPEVYLDAAAAAGADAVSASPSWFVDHDRDAGPSLPEAAAARGLELASLDGVYDWLPLDGTGLADRVPKSAEVLALAEEAGIALVSALAVATDLDEGELADRFGRLCDRAADHGCAVQLEFSPLGGVADLASAWAMVESADRPNGGILFDTWHFFRGDPDLGLLARLPGDRVFGVQLADAAAEVAADGLWADTMHHRRLPGEGAFDLEAVVAVLADSGGLARYGPEVISDDLAALGPREAARRAMAATRRLVAGDRIAVREE